MVPECQTILLYFTAATEDGCGDDTKRSFVTMVMSGALRKVQIIRTKLSSISIIAVSSTPTMIFLQAKCPSRYRTDSVEALKALNRNSIDRMCDRMQ